MQQGLRRAAPVAVRRFGFPAEDLGMHPGKGGKNSPSRVDDWPFSTTVKRLLLKAPVELT